ncbi:MAG: hypothetical protein ACQESC_02375 [Nanobdellota archaeon]
MTELIPITAIQKGAFSEWEFRVKDSFSLDTLYKQLHEFLIIEEWEDIHSGKDDFETNYEEHENDDGSIDHMIWWRATKYPKITGHEYIKLYLRLDIVTQAMKEKEVMIKGKKIKLDKGELKIRCSIYIDKGSDRDERKGNKSPWDTHVVLKHFKKYFWNRMNKNVDSKAKGEVNGFSRDLRHFLEVYTGVKKETGPRAFVPVKGGTN